MLKKIAILGLVAGILMLPVTATAQNHVTANKKYQTKSVSVGNFDSIILNGSPDVYYTQTSGKTSVEIYASSNIIPLLETSVKNGTLIVQFKKNTRIRNTGKVEIKVSGPALSSIKVNGSGDIHLKNGIDNPRKVNIEVNGSGDIGGKRIKCSDLEITVKGSGDINLTNIKSRLCQVKVQGSGDIYLSGQTMDADYNVNGSGDISASDLKAENVAAYVNGSGDIKCHARNNLKGKVNGSGDVAYSGRPQIDFPKRGLRKL